MLLLLCILGLTAYADDQTVTSSKALQATYAASSKVGEAEFTVKLGKADPIQDRKAAYVFDPVMTSIIGTPRPVRVVATTAEPLRFFVKTADGVSRLQNQTRNGTITVHYTLAFGTSLFVTSEYPKPWSKKVQLRVEVREAPAAPVVAKPTPPAKPAYMKLAPMVIAGELTHADRTQSGANADTYFWRVNKGDELTIAASSHSFDPGLIVTAPGQDHAPHRITGVAATGIPVPLHLEDLQAGFLSAEISHGVLNKTGTYQLVVATPMDGDLCASIEALDTLAAPDPWKVHGMDYRKGKGAMQGIMHQRYPRPFDACKISELGRISVSCLRSRVGDEAGMRAQYEATADAFRACHAGWEIEEMDDSGRRIAGVGATKGRLHRHLQLRSGSVRVVDGKAVDSHHLSLSMTRNPDWK